LRLFPIIFFPVMLFSPAKSPDLTAAYPRIAFPSPASALLT
jgi:hypothetical protein